MGYSYDAAGHLTNDGTNQYLYDGEGRVCAVYRYQVPTSMTEYLYDAEGRRVAKASITSFSCNPLTNGGSLTKAYIVGLDGEQLGETNGTGTLLHSNVFLNGALLATNVGTNWYYALNDWLGTKRMQANADGTVSATFESLPFGDGLAQQGSGTDASEQHFTGKERDAESENDYFGARYYESNMGRFLSPDWSAKAEPVPYSKLDNPQTLNLYAYVGNNPLSLTDPTGHGPEACLPQQPCVYVDDKLSHGPHAQGQGNGSAPAQQQSSVTVEHVQGHDGNPAGHAVISVDGKTAVGLDQKRASAVDALEGKTSPGAVVPVDPSRKVEGTAVIPVTPGQAGKIQTFLDNASKNPPGYNLYNSNCAQFCERALQAGGVKNVPNDITPGGLIHDLNQGLSFADYLRIVPLVPFF